MAVGDAVGEQFYHNGSVDLQPSAGVEWCITSMMSSSTGWYYRDYQNGNIFYAEAGQGIYGNQQFNAMKLFMTNTNKVRWWTSGASYSRYSGVVTKE